MQRSKDTDHLAIYSDATYPVGPDASGRITYIHVPPLNPLTIIIIALVCIAIVAFLCCYFSPVVRKCYGSRTTKAGRDSIDPQVLASTRSLFGQRQQMMLQAGKQQPPHYGRLDMRIARPQPALSLSRRSMLSPSLSPSLSSSCSNSPTALVTPPMYSSSLISEMVVVAPVDMGILGQTVESRTSPKKGGEYYAKVEEA